METHEIKIEIYRRRPQGVSQASIARGVSVSKQAVLLIIERRMRSRRIAQAVADAIERPLAEVFPEYCIEPEIVTKAACSQS
jgi:DNA-binding XRE family transcriptional regulator